MDQIAQFITALVLLFFVVACGVKGDPLPPEKPAEIGRGRPTYRRATEPLKNPNLPGMDDNDSTSDEDQQLQEGQ